MPTKTYYVTVIDGPKRGFLLGPYTTHQEALNNVERGRKLANEADAKAAFYFFGTAGVASDSRQPKTVFGE